MIEVFSYFNILPILLKLFPVYVFLEASGSTCTEDALQTLPPFPVTHTGKSSAQ